MQGKRNRQAFRKILNTFGGTREKFIIERLATEKSNSPIPIARFLAASKVAFDVDPIAPKLTPTASPSER